MEQVRNQPRKKYYSNLGNHISYDTALHERRKNNAALKLIASSNLEQLKMWRMPYKVRFLWTNVNFVSNIPERAGLLQLMNV